MQISPRYDGPPILEIPGTIEQQLAPLVRQRRRMQAMLEALSAEQWLVQSRCAEWSVQGVVAHLVGVNAFWTASVQAGVAGNPTRFLARFDPAATPAMMVSTMTDLAHSEVFDRFIASNEAFLAAMEHLDEASWSMLAESPAGHVPIRLVAAHATWDSWVHERDIVVPLGLESRLEHDEIAACLTYAAAISLALAIGFGLAPGGRFAVAATDPEMQFVLEVGDAVVCGDATNVGDAPCLRGAGADLIDALSIRAPLPAAAPDEWRGLLAGLAAAFDTPSA